MSERRLDVLVVGGANTDYLIRAARLPAPGESIEGEAFQMAPGGKGANQAVAAARLGARVALLGRVGADAGGDAVLQDLAAEGVHATHVARDPRAPTGVALIQVGAGGEKQSMGFGGANRRLSVEDIERATPLFAAARVVLIQLEIPLDTVLAAVALARESGARVVLDPAPPVPLPAPLYPLLDVIRSNSFETSLLTGVPVHDRASARRAAEVLLARGAGAAAVQGGGDGNLFVWPGGERWVPVLPVPSIDTTGSGDAFAAALAVMLAEGRTLDEAAPFAGAAAAAKSTRLGAQAGLPTRAAVEALLAASSAA